MKVSEVTGKELDFLVAKCRGLQAEMGPDSCMKSVAHRAWGGYFPSTSWQQGGPIIEQEKIMLSYFPNGSDPERWSAGINGMHAVMVGETPLIAAMRCYVVSKVGEEVA